MSAASKHVARIAHLFVLTTVVAGVVALVWYYPIAAFAIMFFPGPQLVVVVAGTAIYVSRAFSFRLSRLALRGAAAGACLAMLWFGWIPVIDCLAMSSFRPLAAVAGVVAIGGLLGALIGVEIWWSRRRQIKGRESRFVKMHAQDRPWLAASIGEGAAVTDRVRLVMRLASDAARRSHQSAIEPAHLLVALVEEGSGVAAYVLKQLNISHADVHRVVSSLGQTSHQQDAKPPGGILPLAESSVAVLRNAVVEAKALGREYVGTEHLLLSLTANAEASTWAALRVTADQVRSAVLAILGTSRSS